MKLSRLKCIVIASATALVALLCWHALFGRLVPLSGLFIGFDRLDSEHVTVRFHRARETAEATMALVDEVLSPVAHVIGLEPRRRIDVVLCGSGREYRRLTGSKARFITVGDRIFVSPRALDDARTGAIHLRTYLAHELAHAVMAQHQGLLGALRRPPAWLDEGLATFAAGQVGIDGYFDAEAVCSELRQGRAVPPSDYARHTSDAASLMALPEQDRYHFTYSEFAFFVRDLSEIDGAERFQRFLAEVGRGEDWVRAFVRAFGVAPDERFEAFRRRFCARSPSR